MTDGTVRTALTEVDLAVVTNGTVRTAVTEGILVTNLTVVTDHE